ncbi:hypothetical protein ElyMa_006165300 [Elysia marginata]|uniref:Uncharacterized protein n=1 Tax=Elysia marginata TaxID=1093978 RepID=A0AAV4H087_9GAST|nr:hypothetical protein ElyMa_006165300 [Elysia marginata]
MRRYRFNTLVQYGMKLDKPSTRDTVVVVVVAAAAAAATVADALTMLTTTPSQDPSMHSENPADNDNNHQIQDDRSAASITEPDRPKTQPDGDSGILRLFTVGDKQNSIQSERDGSGGSEKGKFNGLTGQKRLSVSSKVGHVGGDISHNNSMVGNSKPVSSPTQEKRFSTTDSTSNEKAIRSVRYVWVSIKRKLSRRRGARETAVKEIHIPPEQGEDKWANRSFTDHSQSNSTRSSNCSSRAGSSGSRRYGQQGKEKTTLDADLMQYNDSIITQHTEHSLHNPENRWSNS